MTSSAEKTDAIANANAFLKAADLPACGALVSMLEKLCDRSVPAGADSCDQAMVKMRAALIDEVRAVIAKAAA
ncbi:hypothetical protein [Azospirillum palustre]